MRGGMKKWRCKNCGAARSNPMLPIVRDNFSQGGPPGKNRERGLKNLNKLRREKCGTARSDPMLPIVGDNFSQRAPGKNRQRGLKKLNKLQREKCGAARSSPMLPIVRDAFWREVFQGGGECRCRGVKSAATHGPALRYQCKEMASQKRVHKNDKTVLTKTTKSCQKKRKNRVTKTKISCHTVFSLFLTRFCRFR